MKAAVVDTKGKKIKEIDLNEDIFNRKSNEPLVHQVVTAEMANKRQGSASTKTRAMVAGGGTKPWRQKGTGRARAGSIRSPLWKGGGVTFGPQPRDFYTRIPKKMRKGALKSALSAKFKNSEIIIIDNLEFKEPKTKKAEEILDSLKIYDKTTVVIPEKNDLLFKSFRNIPGVEIMTIDNLTVYDILNNKKLIITNDAISKLTEVLSG